MASGNEILFTASVICKADAVNKISFGHLGHISQMPAMPIYGKTTFKNLLQNQLTDFHETWYVESGTRAHHSLFK